MDRKIPLSNKQMAFLLATMTAIMPLSVDAYLPAILSLSDDLQVPVKLIEKSLSSFMFGVAFGQLLGGAVSDVKGRRTVALGGLGLYATASLALALLQTMEQLVVLRLLQAFGGGMAAVMAGAVVRDFYEGRQAAQMFALIGIVMMSAPLAAPMLGSGLQRIGGWRLIFVFLLLYSLAVFALMWRFLPKSEANGRLDRHFFGDMLRRYRRVLQTVPALGFMFFQAFSFGSMFVFLTESSFVYMKLYGLTPFIYAFVFGSNIVTMMAFNRITAWRLKSGSNAEDILLWGLVIQFGYSIGCKFGGIVVGVGLQRAAAVTFAGAVPDGFGRHPGFGYGKHAGLLYVLFQGSRRQRECFADGGYVADWCRHGLAGDVAA